MAVLKDSIKSCVSQVWCCYKRCVSSKTLSESKELGEWEWKAQSKDVEI